MSTSNRRKFMKFSIGTTGALLSLGPLSKALASTCDITPPQTPGPFYPGEDQFSSEKDLTRVPGSNKRAEGQVVYVKGKVVDQQCRPIKDANVEIWQACATGRYNNPRDTNPAPLDPNFLYWAEAYTNEKGEYLFKTIIPGEYPASSHWVRPPHIHFKVARLGYNELVTQMYFKDHHLNSKDLILNDIPSSKRKNVIIDFQPSPQGYEPGSLLGTFDLTIIPVRGS